jgi:hypothetical protein
MQFNLKIKVFNVPCLAGYTASKTDPQRIDFQKSPSCTKPFFSNTLAEAFSGAITSIECKFIVVKPNSIDF